MAASIGELLALVFSAFMALISAGLSCVSLPTLNFSRNVLVTFYCHNKIARENPELQPTVPGLHCFGAVLGQSIMVELDRLLLDSCEEESERRAWDKMHSPPRYPGSVSWHLCHPGPDTSLWGGEVITDPSSDEKHCL